MDIDVTFVIKEPLHNLEGFQFDKRKFGMLRKTY